MRNACQLLPQSETRTRHLLILQKWALRIISFSPPRSPFAPLLKRFEILTIFDLVKTLNILFVYQLFVKLSNSRLIIAKTTNQTNIYHNHSKTYFYFWLCWCCCCCWREVTCLTHHKVNTIWTIITCSWSIIPSHNWTIVINKESIYSFIYAIGIFE